MIIVHLNFEGLKKKFRSTPSEQVSKKDKQAFCWKNVRRASICSPQTILLGEHFHEILLSYHTFPIENFKVEMSQLVILGE